jgi:pimeloyl-ACP methyl ester carboxylesterase
VDDLHRLLQKAGVTGPYVMVGHSIGGIYVRQYAAYYPNEVAGIVLMDSSHPDQLARVPAIRSAMPRETRIDATLPTLARLGIWRLYFAAGGKLDFNGLPPHQFAEVTAFWSSPENLTSLYAETAAIPSILADAHPLGGLGSLPLAVITHGAEPPAYLVEMQNELALLSSNSLHITVPGATHLSLALNPEHASFTSRAILQVVQAARTGQRLAEKTSGLKNSGGKS